MLCALLLLFSWLWAVLRAKTQTNVELILGTYVGGKGRWWIADRRLR